VIVQTRRAGVGSLFPTASVARTRKVYEPSLSSVYVLGDEHDCQDALPSLHSKVLPVSDELKVKLAVGDDVLLAGPESIVVWGARVSTRHARLAGVSSTLPDRSRARTSNVCVPSQRSAYSAGDTQLIQAPPSSAHWKDEPGSLEAKENEAQSLLVSCDGPLLIVVSGGVLSGRRGGGGSVGGGDGGGGSGGQSPSSEPQRSWSTLFDGGTPSPAIAVWSRLR
jgi:hypothetical protein